MIDRSAIVEWVRSEVVGPSRSSSPAVAGFGERVFQDPVARRRGPLAWKPTADGPLQEVLYFERESPHRKYGAGLLHPPAWDTSRTEADTAMASSDTVGVDEDREDVSDGSAEQDGAQLIEAATDDEFEVTDPDVRRPLSLAISVCIRLERTGALVLRLPAERPFAWQCGDSLPLQLNGRYERCTRRWHEDDGPEREGPIWRRVPAVGTGVEVRVPAVALQHGRVIREAVPLPVGSPIQLRVEVFPRLLEDGGWLVTVVLRNTSVAHSADEERERTLYQSFFELAAEAGEFRRYPETARPFESLDPDEQSLALLYRDSATWAVGHGCAGGWDSAGGAAPPTIYADVMPAVELPSMTPDVEVDGSAVSLSMRELSKLQEDGTGDAWESLRTVRQGYATWIEDSHNSARQLSPDLAAVAARHLDMCRECLARIDDGLQQLAASAVDREAFKLANLSMLLQQISTKHLRRRGLAWNVEARRITPTSRLVSPVEVLERREEDATRVGRWRAFQIAFVLMSIRGLADPMDKQRELVDLIWFPTGGGKTEAYLAVMAFYMFRERLLMGSDVEGASRDGTNVLMRYTLRMLTTQQFQRAASLICAMEQLRRKPQIGGVARIPGKRFSLGLWIGGDGSPNKLVEAQAQVSAYRAGRIKGNPLVLTECPWCRCELGRVEGTLPRGAERVAGILVDRDEGPRLLCPDSGCEFGAEAPDTWLPVEVIDERIYRHPPSLVIATADKLAMTAYRPAARALFGLGVVGDKVVRVSRPPGLIIQDELHLISGPLGTMYALYEGVFERLCSETDAGGHVVVPKVIASTATIRGAAEQVSALYGRSETRLFPAPGLSMGDSFFGRYATSADGALKAGRMYIGLHAADYGSALTTQVRTFAAALFQAARLPADRRDPWWTLLAFYNSIRELGGARTLFDSDIRSRLKFLFNREDVSPEQRRNLRAVDELTSRLAQSEIVEMMDRLGVTYPGQGVMDACLASNIIEVGVDIDRLSLMGIVGQPKTTSTYIQVSGRVGRRWQDRPGLILAIYNPSKSRDRSHFEQFHSYHRRLYERVEPTSTTPFAISALRRGLTGVLLAWAREMVFSPEPLLEPHLESLQDALDLIIERCRSVQSRPEAERSIAEMRTLFEDLLQKWRAHPQNWEQFPQSPQGEYLMLWPGQFATELQRRRGVVVPSSMRQVDASAELSITPGYALASAVKARS
jgi:hypothetical protein